MSAESKKEFLFTVLTILDKILDFCLEKLSNE